MIFKYTDIPQILALLSASLASVSSGSLLAFLSPAIPELMSDYNFSLEGVSYLVIVAPIAMLLTAPVFPRVVDKIGRKYTILITGVLQLMAWIVTAFARDIYVFCLSRILSGASDSAYLSSLPIYIAEVSTPRIRSLYGNTLSIIWFLGQFLVNLVGFYFNIQLTSLIMLIPALIHLSTFAFMPDTPYYLIMIGDMDTAKRSLQKLRSHENVDDEFKQIATDVQRQMSETGRFKDVWLIESNRKALLIACLARTFNQLSGFSAINVYCQYIFQQTGGDVSSGVAGMILTGMLTISVTFASGSIDKFGRRNSIIVSCMGCAIALLSEAIYFYLQVEEIVDLSMINWFPVLGIVLYAGSFSAGLAAIPTLLAGEIFSTSIRKHATAILNILFGCLICIISKLFQMMVANLGLWVPFALFGVSCFVNSILSYFIIPETKGKTLEEIQQILKGSKKRNSNQ